MRGRITWSLVLAVSLAAGCKPASETQPKEVPASLKQYVRDSVPRDAGQRTYVDFEGKVRLVGYDVKPERAIRPGGSIQLEMHWQSVAPLGPGWSLFTHLVDEQAQPLEGEEKGHGSFDDVGPLRARATPDGPQALPPSDWLPGKIYVDTQELRVPPEVEATRISVLTGIAQRLAPSPAPSAAPSPADSAAPAPSAAPKPNTLRLRIVSGTSDGADRAVVGHFDVVGAKPKARQQPTRRARRLPGASSARPLRHRPAPRPAPRRH